MPNTIVRDSQRLTGIALVDFSGKEDSLIHAKSIAKNNALSTYISKKYNNGHIIPNGDVSHNWEGRINNDGFDKASIASVLRDASNRDFRPKANSQLVDTGQIIIGSPYIDLPDIGAYEFGDKNYRIPGRKLNKSSMPVPKNDGHNVATQHVDLMWLNAYGASSHDVYIGTAPDNLTIGKTVVDTNIVSITDLSPNSQYYWRVDANTEEGSTIQGDVWTFSTDETVTTSFHAIADASVNEAIPNQNFGSEKSMPLNTGNRRGTQWGYIKFNINVPTTIKSAKLRIYNNSGSPTSNVGVFNVEDSSWLETAITRNNKPPMSLQKMGNMNFEGNTWRELNLTTIDLKNGELSLGLIREDGAHRQVASKESSAEHAAQLIITHDSTPWNDNIKQPIVISTDSIGSTDPTDSTDPISTAPNGSKDDVKNEPGSSGGGSMSFIFILLILSISRAVRFK